MRHSAKWNFVARGEKQLSLEVGDTVQIQEVCDGEEHILLHHLSPKSASGVYVIVYTDDIVMTSVVSVDIYHVFHFVRPTEKYDRILILGQLGNS